MCAVVVRSLAHASYAGRKVSATVGKLALMTKGLKKKPAEAVGDDMVRWDGHRW